MALETVWRQKSPRKLTDAQRKAKLQKDSEYEIAVQNLSAEFYKKKRSVGVTPKEEAQYNEHKSQLWSDYYQWAISQGLYEEVTPEQQLAEAEDGLNTQIEEVNLIRAELKRPLLETRERTIRVR